MDVMPVKTDIQIIEVKRTGGMGKVKNE